MPDNYKQTTISPHNQQPLVARTYPSVNELDDIVKAASEAQKKWSKVPLKDRISIGRKFMVSMRIYIGMLDADEIQCVGKDEFEKMKDEFPMELTVQMGR